MTRLQALSAGIVVAGASSLVAVSLVASSLAVAPHSAGPQGRNIKTATSLPPGVASPPASVSAAATVIPPSSAPVIYKVPGSITSDCSVDVTSALSSWIASVPNGSTLLFGASRCYRVEGTLEVRGRSGLTFHGNGSTFRSFKPMVSGMYEDDQRAIWRAVASSQLVFADMTLTGAYARGGTFTAGLQHAHALDFRGTSAEVANVKVNSVAGDCVYFGLGYDGVTRSSGSFHDSSCSGTGRNGVSATAANNLTVSNDEFSKVGYVAVDLEPNVGSYTTSTGWGTSNVLTTRNKIGSYYLYAFAIVENGPNVDDSFTGNTITSSKGFRVGVVTLGVVVRPSVVVITGNTATAATWSPGMEIQNVDGLTVTDNTVPMSGGAMATVDHSCSVDVSGNRSPGASSQVSITNPTC